MFKTLNTICLENVVGCMIIVNNNIYKHMANWSVMKRRILIDGLIFVLHTYTVHLYIHLFHVPTGLFSEILIEKKFIDK